MGALGFHEVQQGGGGAGRLERQGRKEVRHGPSPKPAGMKFGAFQRSVHHGGKHEKKWKALMLIMSAGDLYAAERGWQHRITIVLKIITVTNRK